MGVVSACTGSPGRALGVLRAGCSPVPAFCSRGALSPFRGPRFATGRGYQHGRVVNSTGRARAGTGQPLGSCGRAPGRRTARAVQAPPPSPSGRAAGAPRPWRRQRPPQARRGAAPLQTRPRGRRARDPVPQPLGDGPGKRRRRRSGGPKAALVPPAVRPCSPPLVAAMNAGQAAGEEEDGAAAAPALPRVLSALFYGTCSFLTVLVNKALLSAYR